MASHRDASFRDRIRVRLGGYARTLSSTFTKTSKTSPNKVPRTKNTLKVPGFGRPLAAWSEDPNDDYAQTLSAVMLFDHKPITLRERSMLYLVNSLTDKPDWELKVHDEEVIKKWEQEALNLDWSKLSGDRHGMSKEIFNYCIEELRDKAKLYEQTGVIPVLDAQACVLKGDHLVPADLKSRLHKAVAVLEDAPEHQKDWHPGSDGKVLNLVHPSLFPLMYGRSRILPDRTISVEDCLGSIGGGVTIGIPSLTSPEDREGEETEGQVPENQKSLWSTRFQWLPCNVSFPDGEHARLDSYINNLHPTDHKDLYKVIEELITIVTPLWNIVYQCSQHGPLPILPRIKCTEITYTPHPYEQNPPADDGSGYIDSDAYFEAIEAGRKYNYPSPRPYSGLPFTAAHFNSNLTSPTSRTPHTLQVIVKLANIHLTPAKPTYAGGTWHIEGQLNEHIVATALYYYSVCNTSPSHLAFRTSIRDADLAGVDYEHFSLQPNGGIEKVFGFANFAPAVQRLGAVRTREDRVVVFPNGLQHRVEPFELADRTAPGHRKIMALFLVAPTVRVISTANVPPQRRDWWVREVKRGGGRVGALPVELVEKVAEGVGEGLVGVREAREVRKELMLERGLMDRAVDRELSERPFTFCEH